MLGYFRGIHGDSPISSTAFMEKGGWKQMLTCSTRFVLCSLASTHPWGLISVLCCCIIHQTLCLKLKVLQIWLNCLNTGILSYFRYTVISSLAASSHPREVPSKSHVVSANPRGCLRWWQVTWDASRYSPQSCNSHPSMSIHEIRDLRKTFVY